MTKKDYKLIASVLKPLITEDENFDANTARTLAYRLSDKLQDENPRFNSAKFLDACGIIPD